VGPGPGSSSDAAVQQVRRTGVPAHAAPDEPPLHRSGHLDDRIGILIGFVFPPVVVLLGLPADRVITPVFFATTLAAGLVVGAVNFGLARLVVGRRMRVLANSMRTVEERMAHAVFTHDWTGCDPESCSLPVDSQDEPCGPLRAPHDASCAKAMS